MAKYLLLTTLTDTGRKTIMDNPDRIKEVDKEIELMGIKILAQYALLGQYDFVNIIEAPSDEIAAKLAINLSARGSVTTLTLTAMTIDDLVEALKKEKNSKKTVSGF
ncbi:GYD domain-containing protein [Chloroflexota bacterium]